MRPVHVCVGVLSLLTVALPAQPMFGPPPVGGGGGPNPMAALMERVASGVLEDANPLEGYLQVGVPMRGSRIVIVGEQTTITALLDVPLSEVKVGDQVTVSGRPAVVVADRVLLTPELSIADIMQALLPAGPDSAPPPGTPAPPAPEVPGPPAGMPGTPMAPVPTAPPITTVSGTVKSVEPLVIADAAGSEVAVTLPEGARVLKRAPADLSAAELGGNLVAIGAVNADGYLEAERLYLGESLSMRGMMGMGFGRGREGGPGFPMGGPMGGPPAPGGGGRP